MLLLLLTHRDADSNLATLRQKGQPREVPDLLLLGVLQLGSKHGA